MNKNKNISVIRKVLNINLKILAMHLTINKNYRIMKFSLKIKL